MTEPTTHRILARSIRPYHWAVWSSTGGDPFANTICSVKWAEDGKQLVFGLESHNFIFILPTDYIDVVGPGESDHMLGRYADWTLPPQPVTLPADHEQLDSIRALLAANDIDGDAVAGVQGLIDAYERLAHDVREEAAYCGHTAGIMDDFTKEDNEAAARYRAQQEPPTATEKERGQ